MTLQKRYFNRISDKVDGVVGHETWSQVVPDLKRGSRGEFARQLQRLLVSFDKGRSPVKVDGVYGPQTTKDVRQINQIMSFETIRGSGEADESVWCALLGGHFDGE